MERICQNCKFFADGEDGGLSVRAMLALDGRSPSTNGLLQLMAVNKDGQCQFMPQGVQKRHTDTCGQFVEKEAQ